MKKTITIVALVAAVLSLFVGCKKNYAETLDDKPIQGTDEFIQSIKSLNITPTKAGEVSEEEALAAIASLFPSAKCYLLQNGYDYSEDFKDDDPSIILTALALAEIDYQNRTVETKGFLDELEAVTNCVIWGADAGTLAGLGAKAIAKKIAKKLAQRAVPYVGAAIGAAEAALCIYNHYSN